MCVYNEVKRAPWIPGYTRIRSGAQTPDAPRTAAPFETPTPVRSKATTVTVTDDVVSDSTAAATASSAVVEPSRGSGETAQTITRRRAGSVRTRSTMTDRDFSGTEPMARSICVRSEEWLANETSQLRPGSP